MYLENNLDRHLARRCNQLRRRRPERPVVSCLGRAEAQASALRQSEIDNTHQQEALEHRSGKEEAPSVGKGGGGDALGGQGEATVGFADSQKGGAFAVVVVLRFRCGGSGGGDMSV